MQGMKYKEGTERARIIKIILALICLAVLVFFLVRYVSLSRNNDDAELLRLVSVSSPLEEKYEPHLVQYMDIQVSESCAEALEQMLSAAEQAGCRPVLQEGYLSREAQQQRYDELIEKLMAQGESAGNAAAQAVKTAALPGTDEHELGLTVDIVDAAYQNRDEKLTDSDTYKWLSEHCWEYGFVIRYPEDKIDVTGVDFMPWHYRFVGVESAGLMRELQLCLEEYYTWFYSDDVIVIH